jgi:hypothetical protein
MASSSAPAITETTLIHEPKLTRLPFTDFPPAPDNDHQRSHLCFETGLRCTKAAQRNKRALRSNVLLCRAATATSGNGPLKPASARTTG